MKPRVSVIGTIRLYGKRLDVYGFKGHNASRIIERLATSAPSNKEKPMNIKLAVAVLFLSALPTFAQVPAPTGLVATEIVSTAPTLGGYFQWNPVAGATYDLYKGGNSECKGTFSPSLYAQGINATTYTIPSLAFGEYCFAVTAVVGGVQSGYSNLIPLNIGNKWYGKSEFNTTPVTYCNGCTWTLTDTDTHTVVFSIKTNSGGNATFTFFADCGNYELTMTLPNGTQVLDDKAPFACVGGVPVTGSTVHTIIYDEGLGLAKPFIATYATASSGQVPTK